MAITRTNWIDDDGSDTTGTVINNAEKQLLYDQIDAALPPAATLKPFQVFRPLDNIAATGATTGTRNGHKILEFDGATDEECMFTSVWPLGYAGGGVTCDVYVTFASATSGSVRFQAAIERMDLATLDIDADSFAAFQSAGGTAPATSGQIIKVAITFTSGAQMDSLAAGESYRLKVRRDADGTSGTDDITTDAQVLRVVLRET